MICIRMTSPPPLANHSGCYSSLPHVTRPPCCAYTCEDTITTVLQGLDSETLGIDPLPGLEAPYF